PLKDVLELEAAIRLLAAETKEEKEARLALVGLTSDNKGTQFAEAKKKLEDAIKARKGAEGKVRSLRFGDGEVEDPEHLPEVRKDLIAELEARRRLAFEKQSTT